MWLEVVTMEFNEVGVWLRFLDCVERNSRFSSSISTSLETLPNHWFRFASDAANIDSGVGQHLPSVQNLIVNY